MTKANGNTPKTRVTDTPSFIEKARTIHSDRYNYDLVQYKSARQKVTIICKHHGAFEQTPNHHLNGAGCRACGYKSNAANLKSSTAEFIAKANRAHNYKYDYSLTKYKSSADKVTIICKHHGAFEQIATLHANGHGCTKCALLENAKRAKLSTATFIKKAKQVHSDRYNYDLVQYKDSQTKVTIICKHHGAFEQTPSNHLKGSQCKRCAREMVANNRKNSKTDFVRSAKQVHKSAYSYELVSYKDSQTKVTIICKHHGAFEQAPADHVRGNGCKLCAFELSGWGRSSFVKACDKNNNGHGFLYVLECEGGAEHFYKIGITSRSVKARYSYAQKLPYRFKVLAAIEGKAGAVYDLEKQLHRLQSEQHYTPKRSFAGSVLECFSELTPQTLALITQSAEG